jgi:hypothetical protein
MAERLILATFRRAPGSGEDTAAGERQLTACGNLWGLALQYGSEKLIWMTRTDRADGPFSDFSFRRSDT